MRKRLGLLAVAGAMASGAPAEAEPIPPATAFELPPVSRCVALRTLPLRLRDPPGSTWASVTVRVDGRRLRHVARVGAKRAFLLRPLPRGRHTLRIVARTRAGGRATVERPYQTCIDERPLVLAPTGDPPTTLQRRDLAIGSIRKARKGHRVLVHYTAVAWSDGAVVGSSWDSGLAFPFRIGSGEVIEGFDRGVRGMKVGGRRELVIPPALGYGEAGPPPVKPNETLVFVVDLVAIR
jgi:peptidylprolyl isomerase